MDKMDWGIDDVAWGFACLLPVAGNEIPPIFLEKKSISTANNLCAWTDFPSFARSKIVWAMAKLEVKLQKLVSKVETLT